MTKTVAGSIADPADFTNVPEVGHARHLGRAQQVPWPTRHDEERGWCFAHTATENRFGNPATQVFAYGMLCALIAAGTWITTATYLELAVSTTHSISERPTVLGAQR